MTEQSLPKIGDRIRLIEMPNDPCPIPAGTEGIVSFVNETVRQIGVKWDTGRSLILVIGVDRWEILAEPFDASKLTDIQLTRCLEEMRRRGAAVAIYDVEEIATMTDGWDNQPSKEEIEDWFDRSDLEETMCEAARKEICRFIDEKDAHQ
ncbi:DUF4314 domain-containing protein [Methylobacterium sp. AMS5]|uniref:DUF4314 domain-containing protein n=1 Tax=Methylobacterium sp. AMS5 TaxID=925818 RepID=UPI00074FA364|nr:DUF4314 domain-containing protein [Methylobacterium sp. AMS5]AMB48314.1 hypothetical protein Y590_25435 [Methylobacterium sp. AMS5]